MQIRLERVEDIAQDIKTFWVKPEHEVRYDAGQFADVYLPHDNPDDRGIRRWITLSSSPTEPLIGLTVTFEHKPVSTYKQAMLRLKPGDTLQMLEPMGDIVLPKDPRVRLVFVAGGIGIVPFRAIAQWLVDHSEHRSIQLLYSATSESELLYEALLKQAYGAGYTPTLTKPHAGWAGQTGRISVERVLDLVGTDEQALIYIAGPQSMVEMLVAQLQYHGVSRQRIAADYFNGLDDIY
jgi:ferredoxin-NADP reductase